MKTFEQSSAYESPWTRGQQVRMLLWSLAWALFCSWTPKPLNVWRLFWLRLFGAKLMGKPFVHQRARITIPWHLTMHDRACLGDRSHAYSLGEVEIGEGATVAQEAYLCTGTHRFGDPNFPLVTAKISVGPYAFVGARAFIMPGAVIGERAVVGACSVVVKNVQAGAVVAGNPARPIDRAVRSVGKAG